jgi:hypothetical protein
MKEGRKKRLCLVSFHLYKISGKGKIYGEEADRSVVA